MLSAEEMAKLARKYDIGNVPGYLSYPAVSKWRQEIGPEEVVAMSRASTENAYLYFHFPYCETLCYYCACYMKVTNSPKQRYDEYISALELEMDLKLRDSDRPVVGEMHWGGGTPTYMDCEQIERVFRAIEKRVTWTPNATLSIEAYPDARTLTDEKLELLCSLGFSQISFGIESLDPRVLEAINRRHDKDSIRHWVEKARSRGLGVHVDLVYGLPYQSEESLRSTIDAVMEIAAPDRLATFLFMYTPSSIKHQRAIPAEAVPDSAARFRLFELLESVESYGYQRVGCDHWVRGSEDPLAIAAGTGDIIYHFQGYEPLSRETFLGFGSSAISFAQNRYFKNTGNLKQYLTSLAEGELPIERGTSHALSDEDQLRHNIIMKMVMSDLIIDKTAIEQRTGVSFDVQFSRELEQLRDMESDGLVAGVSTDKIQVTPLGRTFVRNVARVFDRYFIARPANPALQVLP